VGPTLTLTHPIEVEVAALLTKMIPCAELVGFGKNGSDAVTAAVRLARAVTGKDLIFQYGVHGFHDWFVAIHGVPGVPKALGHLVRSFPYNDLTALEALFEENAGNVAAVVMEPLNVELPEPGYLEGVRELTLRHGALLVFDEMITGFRLANGGAQERFGVIPDLACFGKAIANGMPLSAVVGKRSYMARLPDVAYGMTFRGETLSLVAARAVLQTLLEFPVAEHLEQIGGQVRAAFDDACDATGVNAVLAGPNARMTFNFGDHAAVPPERLETAFVVECARQGVLTNGNILPSLAHDDESVHRTGQAFIAALGRVTELVEPSVQAMSEAMTAGFAAGSAAPDAACGHVLPAAFLDSARDDGSRLVVRGWMLSESGESCTVEAVGPRGVMRVADRDERVDVAAVWPDAPGARDAGFSLVLPRDEFVENGEYSFSLQGRCGDDTIFAVPIKRPQLNHSFEPTPSRLSEEKVLHL
jgi:glutamate-1-semialdehyde aminotransferase